MRLEYAGPNPLISHTGIAFDRKKEDKYRYISYALALLEAVDHEYLQNAVYTFKSEPRDYHGEEMLALLRQYSPESEAMALYRSTRKKHLLDTELGASGRHLLLTPDERSVLNKNLKLMYDYRVQRAVNKSFYYSAVQALASRIVDQGVSYLKVPFHRGYFHVFHSLEGVLGISKRPVGSHLSIYEEKGKLMLRLDIASR